MQQRKTLGLAEARSTLDAMMAESVRRGGRPLAFAIVDDRGEFICFAAMAGVNVALARQNAFKKAYTSAVMRADTLAYEQRMSAAGMKVSDMGNPHFIGGGGGAVVEALDGTILGGLGVSGRPPEEDEAVVQVGKAHIARLLTGG
ncbi:MAG: heme-binding protein [Chloroflexota bacterium]